MRVRSQRNGGDEMDGRIVELAVLSTLKNIMNEYNTRLEEIKKDILYSVEYSFNLYNIYVVPVSKCNMVIFSGYLYPVYDIKEQELLDKTAFLDKNELFVEDIFINEDISKVLALDGQKFSGIIAADSGLYEAEFQLRINNEYFQKIENLYMLTERNKIPWRTLNIPYITKFMSVYLIKAEDGFFESEEILAVDYNLALNYKKDYILCWNVKKSEFIPDETVKPTEERLIYEYSVNTDIYRKYLADLQEGDVFSSHIINNEQLKFITDKKINGSLILWEIMDKLDPELLKYLEYTMYGNEINMEYKRHNLYDIEEIEELILSFEDIDGIKLKKIYLDLEEDKILKKVDLNKFLWEEFKIKDKRTRIYLDFEYKESFLSGELISYILSDLELKYKEFEFLALKKGE